jgi:hypothetical protein
MNFSALEKIANAVLYEGFLLYPYRRSSPKNQHRWHFGTLAAPGSGEASTMQTECLVEADRDATLVVKIRFLQEEEEREFTIEDLKLRGPARRLHFSFPPIKAAIEFDSAPVDGRVQRFTLRIRNDSDSCDPRSLMLSTHTLLAVSRGSFISLIDPPEEYRADAAACRNIGTWPVLAGSEGDPTLMLSSPIILYDYPQIAAESAGDFFDGTEIDEMLTLRVLTLSDAEKGELRSAEDHGRQILERTEMLPLEQMAKLHGAVRSLRKSSKLGFREGDRVRLRPRKKADIMDIALDGKIALIEAVEHDFEDRVHLAVIVEDDPGREFGFARQIGHRFFFSPEEVELV